MSDVKSRIKNLFYYFRFFYKLHSVYELDEYEIDEWIKEKTLDNRTHLIVSGIKPFCLSVIAKSDTDGIFFGEYEIYPGAFGEYPVTTETNTSTYMELNVRNHPTLQKVRNHILPDGCTWDDCYEVKQDREDKSPRKPCVNMKFIMRWLCYMDHDSVFLNHHMINDENYMFSFRLGNITYNILALRCYGQLQISMTVTLEGRDNIQIKKVVPDDLSKCITLKNGAVIGVNL
ncbi:hypothetical protein [Salmon gill poxvirus]